MATNGGFELEVGGMQARGFDWDSVVYPPRLVGEFAELRYGKSLVESSRGSGEVPVFGTNGQCGWHDKPLVPKAGIILGRKGQGHLGIHWCDVPFWVIDTAYYAAVNEAEVDLKWFYYIAKHVGLDHLKTGEKPGLNRDTFSRQYFPFPRLDKQREIARVLGALDDRIELNRRMNRTLEAMAQALFRSWFVDFDPVVAKSAGRSPSVIGPSVAALFPDRFIESEIGSIPEGWKAHTLGDCAELKRGYDLPAKEREPGKVPIISSSGPSGFHSTAMVKGPGVVTGRYGTIGEVYFVEGDFWPLNTTLYVRDFKGHAPRFVEALLKTVDFDRYSDKAAVPGVNRNDLHTEMVAIPPPPIEQEYAKRVESIFDRYSANVRESNSLIELRDSLVPRLLSGEIPIGQADKKIEAAL